VSAGAWLGRDWAAKKEVIYQMRKKIGGKGTRGVLRKGHSVELRGRNVGFVGVGGILSELSHVEGRELRIFVGILVAHVNGVVEGAHKSGSKVVTNEIVSNDPLLEVREGRVKLGVGSL